MSDLVAQFKKAVEEFDRRVEQIRDDQWELPTPCSEWNVRDLVGHLVYEDKWAAPLLEGQTIEQVGDRFEGDLLGDDPLV
ncbi:MAG: maleylpyruvate isomerase family mycothiol-dependent enzyme, partial [Actinomycetota bacterium]|nr:maleylpyruvate isomerase family mycothiol-dependent enzyme [Actinomycetota bacterium]